jgi:hypothetical protein
MNHPKTGQSAKAHKAPPKAAPKAEAAFRFGTETASRRFATKAIENCTAWSILRVEWTWKTRTVKVHCDGACPIKVAQAAFLAGGSIE